MQSRKEGLVLLLHEEYVLGQVCKGCHSVGYILDLIKLIEFVNLAIVDIVY